MMEKVEAKMDYFHHFLFEGTPNIIEFTSSLDKQALFTIETRFPSKIENFHVQVQ